jgi:hypothetical protein
MYLPEDQSAIDYRRCDGPAVGLCAMHQRLVTIQNSTDLHKFAANS